MQLTRAAVRAIAALDPTARFVHADPVLHILPDPLHLHEAQGAEGTGWRSIRAGTC